MNDSALPTEATRFLVMADQIERNAASVFGGAAVIVCPGGAIPPIELLMLDASGDPAQFLGTLLTRIQTTLKDMDEQARMTGMGRLR